MLPRERFVAGGRQFRAFPGGAGTDLPGALGELTQSENQNLPNFAGAGRGGGSVVLGLQGLIQQHQTPLHGVGVLRGEGAQGGGKPVAAGL